MIRKAIIIALVISVFSNLALALVAGESIHFKNGQDPKEFYSLSYEEQIEWKKENMVIVSGINYLKETLASPETAQRLIFSMAGTFLILFFSCFIMGIWSKKDAS